MRRFRFHLGTLVIVVLLFGVGLAALRESNETWDSSIFSITLALLSISILLVVHRTEKRQAFWLGFALFGWTYLGLTLVPSIEPRLMTTKALALLHSKVPRSSVAGLTYADFDNDGKMDLFIVNNSQPNVLALNKGNGTWQDVRAVAGPNTPWLTYSSPVAPLPGASGTTEHFVKIGHSLLAIVVALLGGQLSRYLHRKNSQRASGPVPAPVSNGNDAGV
jgi:hypothetical protein